MQPYIELAQQRAQALRQEADQLRLIQEARPAKRRKSRIPALLGRLRLA
ncbi:hypothetical protein ACFSC4_03880 [Deinococcus malanensis]|nr:hypothetical protein [Deinococcus malanensis]